MSEINPYQAPQSDVSAPDDHFGEIKIFSLQGRIGRLRYLVYTVVFSIILQLAAMPLVMMAVSTGEVNFTALMVITVIIAVIGAAVGAFFVVQRLHDFNLSGWWYLLALAPSLYLAIGPALLMGGDSLTAVSTNMPLMIALWVIVVVFYLVLLFMPGTKASNRFGLEPPPNSTAVKVIAWILVGLLVAGIVLGVIGAMFAPRV